ncbi:TetR/AcrR family transcriptional regulator [Paenibacillus abyssi]|uniref:TetR family transcriptional regulator n=1 Tax=Paenibacillus abyssi TaxID=1340531 RepID=A0A917FM53_9BACL|nr:TetR/AcrR family transcriptional regulator [Paenibacillus abyssi]GGF92116.1 TetR family transcriptional regulator [Paenibacillus abyssi]
MTANRLKQAALKMFAEAGYEGTSLSEIAKAVGIKTPSIYAHFESKEHLFLTLVEDVIQEEKEKFAQFIARISEQPVKEQLYAIFRYFTDLEPMTSGQSFLKRTMMVPPKGLQTQLQKDFMRYEIQLSAIYSRLFERGMANGELDAGNTEDMLALFYGLTDGLLVEHQLYDTTLYRTRQQQLWQWFWRAIAKG